MRYIPMSFERSYCPFSYERNVSTGALTDGDFHGISSSPTISKLFHWSLFAFFWDVRAPVQVWKTYELSSHRLYNVRNIYCRISHGFMFIYLQDLPEKLRTPPRDKLANLKWK